MATRETKRPISETVHPLHETLRSLRVWPDEELLHLARAVGYELIRRNRAVPVALPIGEAVASLDVTVPA